MSRRNAISPPAQSRPTLWAIASDTKTMGIGRREFLRLTVLALAGLAVDPLKAVAVNDNAYVNKKLGILFYKPQDWGFISVKDFGKLKSEQIIGKGLDETTDEIWNELGDPVCVVTKYYETNLNKRDFFRLP